MPRWILAASVCLAACGGRMPVASPAVTPIAPPQSVVPPVVTVATVTRPPAHDSVRLPSFVAAHDSVADAATLDSLDTDQPAASLPDVAIDKHPTWDLNVGDFADEPRVEYYVDYFTGRAHDRFQIWLDRMARYEAYAREQFAARKLPSDFVYLALIESGFSPSAVSHSSAVGIWQFMLGTGRLYGLRVDSWVDERRDPIKATDAAAHDLDDLTQRFGSPYLAAAAYNAGAGRVERGLDRLNTPETDGDDSVDITNDSAFFSLADTRLIRDETKNYVPQLIAAAIVAKEPFKYGFTPAADVAPFPRDSVMVDGGTGLDLIARLADTTLDAIRDLNPQLLRLVTPPGAPYPVRVPPGLADQIGAAYDTLPADQRHAVVSHEVRRGETVAALARRYHVSATLIREANRDARGRSLAAGSMVYLPVNTTIPASFLREPDPPRTTRVVSTYYAVHRGESLTHFAHRVGASVATVRRENHLAVNARLLAGEKLRVERTVVASHARRAPTRARRASTVGTRSGGRTHVVKSGETVSGIAERYGVRQSVLMAANGLGARARIQAGQVLEIPSGGV